MVPDPVTDCTLHPVAVPPTVKSLLVSPVTASLNSSVYGMLDALVSVSAGSKRVMSSSELGRVYVTTEDAPLTLPAASTATTVK